VRERFLREVAAGIFDSVKTKALSFLDKTVKSWFDSYGYSAKIQMCRGFRSRVWNVANCADYLGRESCLVIIILLELAFVNKALRQLCENSAKANRELGNGVADRLRRRVADLRAATCVSDLLVGTPEEISRTDQPQIIIDLRNGFQIRFCANHNTVPKHESGAIDWSKVSRVKILAIETKNV